MYIINLNNSDIKSIKSAEKQKSKLENLGYSLIETRRTGLNTWQFIYSK